MPVYEIETKKYSKRKTIAKVILATLLWAIAIGRIYIYGGFKDTTETLVGAFNSVQLNDTSAIISGFGFYSDVYLSEKARTTFVKDIGYELGLNYCQVESSRDNNLATLSILKEGKYATTNIKLITKEEKFEDNCIESKQYVYVNIDLGNNIPAAMDYQKKLEDLFKDIGVDGQVTLSLTGSIDGKADMAIKDMVSSQIIELTDANIISENKTEEMYTIYAYTKNVDDYIEVSGKKINLNISSYYSEEDGKTFFYVATPIINADY